LFYTYNRMPQQCQCRVVRFQVGQHYKRHHWTRDVHGNGNGNQSGWEWE